MSQKTSDPVYLGCRNRGKVDSCHRLGGVHSAEYRALEGMMLLWCTRLSVGLSTSLIEWKDGILGIVKNFHGWGFREHNPTPGEREQAAAQPGAPKISVRVVHLMRVENNVSNLAVYLRPPSIGTMP
jgi:hypothetical protein